MDKTPFYYFPIGTISGFVITITLTLLYATLSFFRMIAGMVSNGPSAFFAHHDRGGTKRPPILDLYGEHKRIALPKQDITLHYVSAGDEDKQTILFVHGFPECWFSWRHQMEAFKATHHVVAVNMRGYGESDKPRGVSNYSTSILVADLIELIESLRRNKNSNKVILVAHDWGGVLAWNVTQLRPDLVDRFIALNAPHPAAWLYRIQRSWKQFFASWYMFFFNFPFLPEIFLRSYDFRLFDTLFGKYVSQSGTARNDEIDVYKHYFAKPYAISGPLNYYRALLRGYGSGSNKSQSPRLGDQKIEPRTLIIWGRDDSALVEELAQDSAKMCAHANVKYLNDCSHWIQIDQPIAVNEIMQDFLSN